MYTQVIYCLERVPALAKAKPELKDIEPFKTLLSGNREAMAKFTMPDLEKILAATLTGMTVEQFGVQIKELMMLVHHDDATREYAYGPKSKIGTFSDALMAQAMKQGWVVISMKNDWKRIFAFE